MLKDPNFEPMDLFLKNKEHGLYFSYIMVESPIDGRTIPAMSGYTDPSHERWKGEKKSIKVFLTARHAPGIYLGFPMEDMLALSPTKQIEHVWDFDLSTGMYYTHEEMQEQFNRGYHTSDEPLSTGKPPAHMNSLGHPYGLADDISQVLKHYRKVVTNPDVNVVLHVQQHDKTKNTVGMRWHKSGKYIGKHKPKYEYINDEEGFDRFISYHFYVIE